MNIVAILRWIMVVWGIGLVIYMAKDMIAHKEGFKGFSAKNWIVVSFIAFITNFLDCLGIGAFATSQTLYKFTKTLDDDLMPGTLNIGNTIPVVFQGFIFLASSAKEEVGSNLLVEPKTLVILIISSILGAFFGSKIVAGLSVKKVRYALGIGLILLAILMTCRTFEIGPFGITGTAIGLAGVKLVIATVVIFFLAALMMIGVGFYAPCMALVALLGMNVGTAFPIMMGACAYLMLAAAVNFIRLDKYDRHAALLHTTIGSAGVLIAAFIVKSLDLTTLLRIVIVVMIYTAIQFIRDAMKTVENT